MSFGKAVRVIGLLIGSADRSGVFVFLVVLLLPLSAVLSICICSIPPLHIFDEDVAEISHTLVLGSRYHWRRQLEMECRLWRLVKRLNL